MPILSRVEFIDTQSKEMTNELMDESGNVVVGHILDAIEEVVAELVVKLEQKIKEWKKEI